MMIQRKRRIVADEEVMDMDVEMEAGGVDVAPEASDLLFEAEDVAELVAEVTGEPVEVTADEDAVVFTVGDEEFTVEPEGDEEILESVRKNFRGKRTVSASTVRGRARNTSNKGRAVRKVPSRQR